MKSRQKTRPTAGKRMYIPSYILSKHRKLPSTFLINSQQDNKDAYLPNCRSPIHLPSHVDGVSSLCPCRPGLMKSDQFSPDSAALQSILRNEGVKVGGLVGATPRTSVCPSGRNTSVYTVCQQILVYSFTLTLLLLVTSYF